jgi:hypothetical protein
MGRPPDEYVEIEASIERSTTKAMLIYPVDANPADPPIWVPKSQCTVLEEGRDGEPSLVKMTLWIAKQKGLA